MKYSIKNFRTIIDLTEIKIELGKVLVMIGQNGSGKTNILNSINYFSNKSNLVEDDLPKITEDAEDYNEIYSKTRELEINYKFKLTLEEIKEIDKLISSIDFFYDDWKQDMIIDISKDLDYSLANKFVNSKGELTWFGKFASKYSNFFKNKYKISDQYFFDLVTTLEENIFILDATKENLSKISKTTANPNRNEIYKVMEVFNKINNFFIKKPKTLFIKNSASENNLEYFYDLSSLFSENEIDKQETLEILRFISNEVVDLANELSRLSLDNENKNSQSKIEQLKKTIIKKAEYEMDKLFKQFDIYAKPSFAIEGQILKLNVSPKNNYIYNDNIKTSSNSDGYKALLWILFKFRTHLNKATIDKDNNYLFLIDEPDKNIHPITQNVLLNYFVENIKDKNIAVVMTTHSPFLMNNSDVVNELIIYRELSGSTKVSESNLITSSSFKSSYISLISKYLAKENFSEPFITKNIIINTKDEEIINKFEQKIKNMDFDFNVNVYSKEKFTDKFSNILSSYKIEFTKTKNDRKDIMECLDQFQNIEIDQEQLEEIE